MINIVKTFSIVNKWQQYEKVKCLLITVNSKCKGYTEWNEHMLLLNNCIAQTDQTLKIQFNIYTLHIPRL